MKKTAKEKKPRAITVLKKDRGGGVGQGMIMITDSIGFCMPSLTMTCYQLHATLSGSKGGLGGNTQALRKHPQSVQTVHFLYRRTPFSTVYTQWRGNILAKTLKFLCSGTMNKQMHCCEPTVCFQYPNHAWGTVWLYSDMKQLADKPQRGQLLVALLYSRAKHTHSLWVWCPGMILIDHLQQGKHSS